MGEILSSNCHCCPYRTVTDNQTEITLFSSSSSSSPVTKTEKIQTLSSNVIHTVTDQQRETTHSSSSSSCSSSSADSAVTISESYPMTVIKCFFLHSFVSLTTEVGWPASHDWTFFLVICYKLTNLGTFRTIVNFQDLPSNLPLQRNKKTKKSLRFNFGNQSLKLSFFLANFQQKVTLELIKESPIRRILLNSDMDLENTGNNPLF